MSGLFAPLFSLPAAIQMTTACRFVCHSTTIPYPPKRGRAHLLHYRFCRGGVIDSKEWIGHDALSHVPENQVNFFLFHEKMLSLDFYIYDGARAQPRPIRRIHFSHLKIKLAIVFK